MNCINAYYIMHISAYYITLNIKQQFMHAAFCSIFHSSDIFWPVWCLIHLGSFGIIWERSIEKCQWLEDGWSMLKQFIAALKQNRWGLHGLDYLQLGQNCWFGLASYRVFSLIYAWYVLQYDSNFTWYVLQYCLSVYVRLVFFESLWKDVLSRDVRGL